MRDKFDRKAQMMDAGTAFFEAKEGYGSILGELKAEMEVYGKVLKNSEIDNKELPFTTKECDLFLDFSNAFRYRYISCLLMDAGDTGKITDKGEHIRRYAAVFKEGNTSSGLRNMFTIIIIAIFTAIGVYGFMQYIPAGFIGIAGILSIAYCWIVPSSAAQETVKSLKQKIEKSHSRGSNPRPAHYE